MSGESPTIRQQAHIDWRAIRRRLEDAADALAKGNAPTGEEARAILRERAAALADVCQADEPEEEGIAVLEFVLSGETYAIESSFIRQTFPLTGFTPLPCTPPFVMGITSVHGRIVSIVDLRKFFDLPAEGLSNLNRVIIVHDREMEFGILADRIVGIRSLPPEELQASLPTLTGIREEYLRGVTGDRLVLLDVAKILADRRLVVDEEIA
jgi:purine-binding chemotaxis protein CheW